MRRRLLPLTALRAFETAARLLSFNKAAEELGVTTSAVSRQVATLEELIGAPLFIRGVRHIALTDDGRELQKIVFRSLDDIDRGLEDLMARARERATQVTQLRVRLLTTLATRLVLPHLARLEAEHADLQVLLTVASNSEDRREAACDLSIGYSRVAPSEGEEILFPDEAVPVCAPHYLANLDVAAPPSADRLLALRLLGSTRDLWDWRIWARHAGAAWPAAPMIMLFETDDLAIQAALAGTGVALAERRFVASELADGRLVAPTTVPPVVLGHYTVRIVDGRRVDGARLFVGWMRQILRAAESAAAQPRHMIQDRDDGAER